VIDLVDVDEQRLDDVVPHDLELTSMRAVLESADVL
jgi:hypothetical protein